MTQIDETRGLTAEKREELVLQLSRQVLLNGECPYPELRSALESLVDGLTAEQAPSSAPDWPQVIGEALTLRPKHGS
jgi:hypothetical protein